MSTPTPPIESLTLRKKLPCSPEQAFRAWTDPEQFQQWFVAMPGMTVKAQMDVRLGGKYRISCARAGEPTKFVGGEFLVVDPPRRLEYTWIWEKEAMPEWKDRSVVKLAFNAIEGGKTELVLTHDHISNPEDRADHREGWTKILDSMAEALARK
jgi:uncharacterized protein YndB with AHSA1/START domain